MNMVQTQVPSRTSLTALRIVWEGLLHRLANCGEKMENECFCGVGEPLPWGAVNK